MKPWEKYTMVENESIGPWAKYGSEEDMVPRGTTSESTQPLSPWSPQAAGLDTFLAGKSSLADVGKTSIERIRSLGRPETWKTLGQELSFPKRGEIPSTDEQVPDQRQLAEQYLAFAPFSSMAKAARVAITRPGGIPSVEKLVTEGITPTLGQKIGGAVKRTEEALTSVPLLGDVIKSAQLRGLEDFNRAAINRTLKPIGESLSKKSDVGHAAIDFAHLKLSSAYDELLPKLTGRLDSDLGNALKSVDDFAKTMPEAQAKQLSQIVENNVIRKFDKSGFIFGENLKDSLSRVGKLVRQYSKSENPDHQLMGEALASVKEAVSSMLARQNPRLAERLKNIDSGYANLVRIEKAASALGAKGGIFTPAQLNQAIKAVDATVRKSGFARGKSLMQDLATSGQEVLASTVPDSGTALRLSPYIIAGGAGYAGEQGYINPTTALGIAGLATAYTRPGQAFFRGTNRLITDPRLGAVGLRGSFALQGNSRNP